MKPINTKDMRKAYYAFRFAPKENNNNEWYEYFEKSEKLIAAIKESEGRATARTISPSDILNSLDVVERKLCVTKKALEGCVIDVDVHAQAFAKAYKYTPESTKFIAEFTKGSWRILGIERARTRNSNQRYIVKLSELAKEEIIRNHTIFE